MTGEASSGSALETETADALMERLRDEAQRRGDPRRIGTLSRLVEACNDLQSGAAYKTAKAAREKFAEMYDPRFLKLNSALIGHYVDYRHRIEGHGSAWTGPHEVTIRRNSQWMAYLRLRAEETRPAGAAKRKSEASRRLDEMIDRIPDMHERDQIRTAVERGRQWKRQLDIAVQACRIHPEIDIGLFMEGGSPEPRIQAPPAPSAIGPADIRLVRQLVLRLQDNGFLDDLELVYRNGRLKMSSGAGIDLVLPEEMRLLERLAGVVQERPLPGS